MKRTIVMRLALLALITVTAVGIQLSGEAFASGYDEGELIIKFDKAFPSEIDEIKTELGVYDVEILDDDSITWCIQYWRYTSAQLLTNIIQKYEGRPYIRYIEPNYYVYKASEFQESQSVPTLAASDWEFFTIESDYYLAVAGRYNNTESKIYQWDGSNFVEFQSIPTHGASGWEFFTIGSDNYLAVDNYYYGSYSTDPKIYKWDGTSFVEFHSIPTNWTLDWEFFTIESDHYLAVANCNNSTNNTESKIYKWDGSNFAEFQSVLTNGAFYWEFFTVESDHYLAVINYLNNSARNTDSKIYKWDGNSFVEFQSVLTNGASDREFFTIGNDHYMAVANYYDGASRNTDSKIYKWDGSTFAEFQSVPTNGAYDWEFFTVGSDHYLAVANNYNDSDFTHNTESKIYKWDGSSFAEFQSILTTGAVEWEFFTINSDQYLAVANHKNDDSMYNLDSKIYKFNCLDCTLPSANVVLDMDTSTPEIKSVIPLCGNDEVQIAVTAQNVTDLDTYQAEVNFPTDRLQFLEGAEGDNLLKQNGGTTVGFQAVEHVAGTINIVNAIAGSDENQAADGSGILALLKFKVLETGDASDIQLALGNVFFIDCNGNEDTITDLAVGTISIDTSCKCSSCDFNGDETVDELDLSLLANNWLLTDDDTDWDPVFNIDTKPDVTSGKQIINYKDLGIFADCIFQ